MSILGWVFVGLNFVILIVFLAVQPSSSGDYGLYSGGYLRTPPGEKKKVDGFKPMTDEEKEAGFFTKGWWFTLVVGKGLKSRDQSKFFGLFQGYYLYLNIIRVLGMVWVDG